RELNPRGELHCELLRRQLRIPASRKHEQELIAAEAEALSEVLGSNFRESLANASERNVAGSVAVLVVDRLETGQVHVGDAERALSERILQFEKGSSGEQPGPLVRIGVASNGTNGRDEVIDEFLCPGKPRGLRHVPGS